MKREQTRARAVPWILFALTLAGVLSRAYRLCRYPVWLDESTTYHVAKHGIMAMLRIFDKPFYIKDPPIYYFITHLFLSLSDSTASLRMPALLFGVAGIPAVYLLGKRLAGERAGLIAAFLLLLSGFDLYYSQEARAYTLLLLVSILSIDAFLSLLRRPTRTAWILYASITAVGLYSHYLTACIFLSQIVFYAFYALLRRGPGERGATRWRDIGSLATTVAVVAASYLPWLPIVLRRSTTSAFADTTPPILSLSYLRALRIVLAGGPRAGVVYLVLAALGAAQLWRKGKIPEVVSLVFTLVFSAVAVNIFLRNAHFFSYRYYIFLLGPFLALAASGADMLCGLTPARVRPVVLTAFVAAVLWLQGASIIGYYTEGYTLGTNSKHLRTDPPYSWETLVNELRARRGTQMIVPIPFYYIQALAYYLRGDDPRFRFASAEPDSFFHTVIGIDRVADLSGRDAALDGGGVIVISAARFSPYDAVLARLEDTLRRASYRRTRSTDIANVRVLEFEKPATGPSLP